jgi:hypothetical protein
MANGIGRVGWRNFVSAPTTASIITSGLVLNLDAGNAASYPGTGTTWTDLSGNGNNATLVNGTSYSSTSGGTMVFDGINDYASISNSTYLDLPNNNNTMEFWVNSNQLNNNDIISHRWNCYGAAYNPTYASGYVAGKLSIYYNIGGFLAVSTTTTPIIGQWYHLVGTYDGSVMKIYLNGILENTRSVSGNIEQNESGLSVGSYDGVPTEFAANGKISIVRYYHKALSATEVLQNFDATKSRYGFTSYTARTSAFAAATGITDTTILNALNTFDTGLISNGLDTKMKALYPFVGGTANTHKFNFMDARDADAAFRLQFNGGWVHSSTGAKPNGSNAYANTYLSPSNQLSLNNTHISFYSRTNNTYNSVDIRSSNSSTDVLDIEIYWGGARVYTNNSGYGSFINATTSSGFFINSRIVNNQVKGYRNNIQEYVESKISTNLPTFPIYIGAGNNSGNAQWFSNRECAISSIGSGLTDTEASTFNTLTQALQTSLSRAV